MRQVRNRTEIEDSAGDYNSSYIISIPSVHYFLVMVVGCRIRYIYQTSQKTGIDAISSPGRLDNYRLFDALILHRTTDNVSIIFCFPDRRTTTDNVHRI